jgi:hypothetical protein
MRTRWTQPWRSERELDESVLLGRQALTLMASALAVAGGLLLDHNTLGFRLGVHVFQVGTMWVAAVSLPRRNGPWPRQGGAGDREPRNPRPHPPYDSVTVSATPGEPTDST